MDNENEEQKQSQGQEQGQQKETPLNQLLTSRMVDIYVGPESHHWPLHERLLCYHSPFFASIFYDEKSQSRLGSNKSYGLPEEDDEKPFEMMVGWLYSRSIRAPSEEKDIGPMLDLYLLADKLEMKKLQEEVVELVRQFYHSTSTYPGLRRVQYIYGNTDEDNDMREMMVSSVARQLATSEKIPLHWAKALKRDGQLAVDIIRAVQRWNIDERSVPDSRNKSKGGRGRPGSAFSKIVDERENSMDTVETTETGEDSNLGVESMKSDATEDGGGTPKKQQQDESTENPPPPLPPARRPPDKDVLLRRRAPSTTTTTSKLRSKVSMNYSVSRPKVVLFVLAWVSWLAYQVFEWNR